MHGGKVRQKRCESSTWKAGESKNQSLCFPCGTEVPQEYGEGEPLGDCQPNLPLWGCSPSSPRPGSSAHNSSQEQPDAVCRPGGEAEPDFQSCLPHFLDDNSLTCAESITATIMFSSSPLRKVSSGNWSEKEGS